MKKESILRAWRDPEYRESLSAEERAALPAHPSAAIDLRDEQLTTVRGGDVATIGDISDTVKTSNTPATQSSCCRCCAVAGDPSILFG